MRRIALLCAGVVLAGCASAPGEGGSIDTAKVLAALKAGAAVAEGAFVQSAASFAKECSAEPRPARCADWAKACRAFKLANLAKPTAEVQAVVCEP